MPIYCFDLSVPPKITKWTENMSVREGNEVVLSCEVKGKPNSMVVWKKDLITLPSELSYRRNKIRSTYCFTLSILNFY